MNVLAVIPARYAASRLPGKPLVELCGKPMIQHVWERVRLAGSLSRVIVATDDERVCRAINECGGEVIMTSDDPRSGTDRVAEVAAGAAGRNTDIFVNVQGDEPLIEPAAIDAVVKLLQNVPSAQVGTLAVAITDPAQIMNPHVVKVVCDPEGYALYFSRAPIPWVRDEANEAEEEPTYARHLKHVGLYAFRRKALLEFPTLPRGDLENLEKLEQLRWLENGYKVFVEETEHDSFSVDVPEDVPRAEQLLLEPPEEEAHEAGGSYEPPDSAQSDENP